jgi:hypothetical protein
VDTPADGPAPGPTIVRFTTKVAVLPRVDLAVWQKLNVAAFLASGIAGSIDGIIGQPYEDADGNNYLPLCRQPITILEGHGPALSSALQRALQRELRVAVYSEQMFITTNDDDNRAAVRSVPREVLNLVGIAVYGQRGAVDKALKNLHLHDE